MSIQLFKKWTQAVINSDWDSTSFLYAEDIVNLNPDGTSNVGKEACLEKNKGWDSAFQISNLMLSKVWNLEILIMEVQITCTMTGEMMTADGSKISNRQKLILSLLYDYGNGRRVKSGDKEITET